MANANSTNGSRVRVALYLRASSEDQTESIPAQRMLLERYAGDHGLENVGEYSDFAISGDSSRSRPELQRLLADAKDGKFEGVLVRQLSRLSRRDSLKSAAQIIGPLLDAGVSIYTAANGDLKLDTATGRIMLAVLSEFDHSENVSRSLNVLNGQLRAASNGSYIGAAPYAYHIEGDKHHKILVLDDEAKVAVVRRIFAMYRDGDTAEHIAATLNAEGIPSPSGGKWNRAAITDILTRPAYVGDHRFNYISRGKYHELHGGRLAERRNHWVDDEQSVPRAIKNSADDWVYIRDHWRDVAIIDRETWDAVQARIERQATHKSPSLHNFVFSGLLRCSCGAKWRMAGRYKRFKTKERNQYQCEECGALVVEADVITALARGIKQRISPEFVARLRTELERKVAKPDKPKVNTKKLEAKVAKLERRLLECSSDMVAIVEREIRSIRRQLEDIQRAARQAVQKPPAQLIDAAVAQLFKLPEVLSESEPKRLKARLESVLDGIDIKATSSGHGTRRRWRMIEGSASLRFGSEVESTIPNLSLRIPLILDNSKVA